METRTEIIQRLIDTYGLASYLEIGVQNKENNFNKIKTQFKLGVDPDPNAKATYAVTSNEFFFFALGGNLKFDIIFIDGLHHDDQVERDVENSLACLSDRGWIVVHDCNPKEEIHQRVPRESKVWNGNVWKAWVRLRSNPNLIMHVVDCDYGCGVITKGKQDVMKVDEDTLTWENLEKNRTAWLNLVSPQWFERIFL